RALGRLGRAGGAVDALEGLEVLAPAVRLSLEGHVPPPLPPVSNRRKGIRRSRVLVALPEVDHDRLAGGLELEALVHRQLAVWVAVVLGEREEGAVGFQELDCLL